MPRRRRESSSSSESSSSEDDGPPQEPWLINQQKLGGYVVLRSGTRRYDEWCGLDKHGETVTYLGNGAYFPEGYQPNWNQAKPFRCPIRSCQVAFEFPIKWATTLDAAQAQQVQAQQAAPAPMVQPAAAAPAPAPCLLRNLRLSRMPPLSLLRPYLLLHLLLFPAPAQFCQYFPAPSPPTSSRPSSRPSSFRARRCPRTIPPTSSPSRSSPRRRFVALRRLQPLPPLPEVPPAAAVPENNRARLAQRSATLYSSPIWTYLLALLPRPTPDFPVPKDAALHTFLTFPRRRALPTVWRDRLKEYPFERHLTMKELTTIILYLGAPKSRLPHRDENGRRHWSEKSRFEEITCEFNTPHPDPDRRRGVRKEMGFPRCVGFGEGDLERMEETAGEGQDWKAVRERLGGYMCVMRIGAGGRKSRGLRSEQVRSGSL
ncbi:hypothetical protein B0T13DRAFT_529992 [Neurospora crassa]|nr:hypothetical protein B0T13DRAFT_529992 [Neurospora crassa]